MAASTDCVSEFEISALEISGTPFTNESYQGERSWICRFLGHRDKNSAQETRWPFWRDELEGRRHTRTSRQTKGFERSEE